MAKPKIDKAPIVSYLWKRNVHKKYVMIPNAAPKPVNNVMKTSFCCFIISPQALFYHNKNQETINRSS